MCVLLTGNRVPHALVVLAGALAFLGGCGDSVPEDGERGDAAGPVVVPVGDILLEETYEAYLGNPHTLVVDTADGSFLISDNFQGGIIRFGRDGRIVQRYGRPGEGPGEFKGMGTTFILNDSVVVGVDAQRRLFTLFSREDGEHRVEMMSLLAGIYRLRDGETVLVHFDQTITGEIPTVEWLADIYLTVLSADRRTACVDGFVPYANETRARLAVSRDTLFLLDRTINETEDGLETWIRLYEIDTSGCDWLPAT